MRKLLFFLIACCLSFASFAQVAPITGPNTVCVGSTIALTDATPGGTWTVNPMSIAAIGSGTGVVTGLSQGTATVTYGSSLGAAFYTITVNPLPANFVPFGTPFGLQVCVGSTITVSDSDPGGTWSSSNTTVATIGSTSGIITGVSPGASVISYTLPTGCFVTATVTVNPNPVITGTPVVCNGFNATLSSAPSGGTWSSANTAIADVGSSNGVVTGVSPGTTNITYTLSTGCYAVVNFTVNVQPAPISVGSVFTMCLGSTLTVSDATPGGTWSSSNTSVATIGSTSGVVTAISLGFSVITYMMPTGCYVTTPVFVNPNPTTITGNTPVCVGSTITLSSSPSGGTWSSANTTIADVGSTSGVVTGNSAGTTTITYMLSTGCYDVVTVTVNPVPVRIDGPKTLCVGATIVLSDATPGGTWSSSNTFIATIGSSTGVVTGISPGVVNITYTLGTGCYAFVSIFVFPNPSIITGNTGICLGNNTTLSSAPGGGTWSSSNTSVGTVTGGGVVTGVGIGTSTITYMLSTGCYTTTVVTVSPLPAPIMGPNLVCVGNTIVLSDATPGGTWSSSSPAIATVGSSTGVVTGVSVGGVTITYTMPNGCAVTYYVKVVPTPTPIIGGSTGALCVGSSYTLSDATPGGTWSSNNTTIAIVGSSSGVVTGVSPGIATITYTLSTGCYVTYTLTILPLPGPITGTLSICVGSSTLLSNSVSGGTWSSSNTGVATVGSTSGLVFGNNPGISNITYTLASGCYVIATVTVNPIPTITGPSNVCVGSTIPWAGNPPGGTWTSSNTAIATIGYTSGFITGVAPGGAVITYTSPAGCVTVKGIKVLATPGPITGNTLICVGSTSLLSNASPGGTWSSSNPSVATVTIGTGLVSGISPGTSTITYTGPTGCYSLITVTVTPLPGPISGPTSICGGSTALLSDPTPGGTWSSSNTTVATVGSSSGIVTGLTTGFTIITYMMPSGCFVTMAIKVTAPPAPITGVNTICVGMTTTLANATPGGVWTTSNPSVATVTGTGVVTGVSAGVVNITYTIPPGCYAVYTVTVNPVPAPITGPNVVCATLTIQLTDATPGGVWSSSNTTLATVSGTGVVTGVNPGGVTITYTLTTGCYAVYFIKVSPPCTVEVATVANEHNVEVYPNPAYNELIIKADAGAYNRFAITDALGREVMHNVITGTQTTVNIKQLAPGMYYISLKGDKDMQVVKVVKQ